MSDVEYRVISGDEFKRVIAALKVQDRTLPRKIKSKLRKVASDSIDKVKKAVLALPTTGTESTGLRKRVARGVRLRINRNASSVRIITTMSDPQEAMLPRGLDTPKGWRHPVFPDADVTRDEWEWVQQPGFTWFREVNAAQRDEYTRGFAEVLDEARDMIDDAGL